MFEKIKMLGELGEIAAAARAKGQKVVLAHAEAHRLPALMPLYGLRWCAIILGELLPERWKHRLESNAATADSWDRVRREQIGKAKRLMAELESWSSDNKSIQ